MANKVVVGLDGSSGSARALAWLVTHAARDGAEVVAVHSIRSLGEFMLDLPMMGFNEWRTNLGWRLDAEWCKPLADAGIPYKAVTVEDKAPAAALRDVAVAERADLIVVGAQGHGGMGERLLGSVGYKLAHTARQPIVIVPQDWAPTSN